MSTPIYILIELSLFFIGVKRLQQIWKEADIFMFQQKILHIKERETLQLSGMYAVQKNLDQARLFFCERDPAVCTRLTEHHHRLLQPLQSEIETRKEHQINEVIAPTVSKQSPFLRPASWPNWVPGLRYQSQRGAK